MADAFTGDPEFHTYFLQSDRFIPIESEPGTDDFSLTFIQLGKKVANLHLHILITKILKGVDSGLIAYHLAKFRGVVITHRGIQRCGTNSCLLQHGDFAGIHAYLLGNFLVGSLTAKLITESGTDTTNLCDLIDQMDRKSDRLSLVS